MEAAWAPEPIRIIVMGLASEIKGARGEEVRPEDDVLSAVKIELKGEGVQAKDTKLYAKLVQREVRGLELIPTEPSCLMIVGVNCSRTIQSLGRNQLTTSSRRNPCYHLFTPNEKMRLEQLPQGGGWRICSHP